jgi:3-hydroxyisobutyrate dehydrogenase-like beta-hydroxyacid dehydrogenase
MVEIVGFIGAGRLGEPIVMRLLAAGHQVLVHARRDEVRDRLWIHGAALADSVADVAVHSDIIISCLYSDAQLREISRGPRGLPANAKHEALFVSHTKGTVAPLADLEASSAGRMRVLDALVCGTADDVSAGAATVLLGGASDAVERVTPVLAAYARPIIPSGGLGSALHLKLINDLLFAANTQLVTAAAELGQRLGVETPALLNALTVSSGGSAAAAHALVTGSVDAFASLAEPSLRKDVAACLDAVERAGADPGPLAEILSIGPLRLTPGHP